ncbi:MAG TPA: hypothetical protein VNW96_21335 [Mycobacterium sp.]|jgi:hypothetical protein|nr:hypothetical protein [Mycobacterium sp.]
MEVGLTMEKSKLRRVAAFAVVTGTGVSLALWSAAVAGASPDMTGKSYSDAKTALGQAGFTAVASVVVGDKTAQSSCKVVHQQDLPITAIFVGGDQPTLYAGPGFGNIPTAGQVMLTLSCYQASDVSQTQATGSGDITTKPAPAQSSS